MAQGFEIFAEEAIDPNQVLDVIENQVKENELMIYMKGSPLMPQCGFSARVIQIMNLTGKRYATFNVLSDPAMRDGVKQYGSWPTVPQVYYKGELLGGCDIISEMYQTGELRKAFGLSE